MEIQDRVEIQNGPIEQVPVHFVSRIPGELWRRKKLLILLGIVALAIILRFYHLGSIPAGVEEDETSAAYDAYALLTHGTDRWGNPYPVYLPSWGSGQNALLSYMMIPLIKIIGLNVYAIRLFPALLGVLTVVVLYKLVQKIFGTRAGLLAAFFLCISPWHIMMSRWGLESNLLPCFMLLGVTTLVYAYESKYRKWLIPFSLIFFAISFYAYATAAFVIPTLLVLYLIFNWRTVWQYKWSFLIGLGIFLVLSFPFLLFVLDNYILHQTPEFVKHLPFSVPLLISSRLEQVSRGNIILANLRFFANGFNDDIIWKNMQWYQPLGLLTMPLSCVGIYFNIKMRQKRQWIFLLWLVAASPIFLVYNLNSNRANSLALPLIVFSVVGLLGLYDAISVKQTARAVLSLLLVVTTIYSSIFFYDYFRHYNGLLRSTPYDIGFDSALAHANSAASPGELIYVSKNLNVLHQTDVLLYDLRADTQDFLEHSHVVVVNGHYKLEYYRNYRFDSSDLSLYQGTSFVAILRGNEPLTCSSVQPIFTVNDWKVERCFNQT